jgi:hypothetical protein
MTRAEYITANIMFQIEAGQIDEAIKSFKAAQGYLAECVHPDELTDNPTSDTRYEKLQRRFERWQRHNRRS